RRTGRSPAGSPDVGGAAASAAAAGPRAGRPRWAAAHPPSRRGAARTGRVVSSPHVVVIVSGFPRHSETFALTELNALDRAGMLAAMFSTKPGEDGPCQ